MEKNQINYNISIMRIMATLGVIYMHTNTTLLFNPQLFTISLSQGLFLRMGHELFLWTVPFFFMITGFLLLGASKPLNYSTAIKKYVFRIFFALLLFSVPFAVLKLYGETHTVSCVGVIRAFVGNDSLSHLWYLYALIGLYLIAPILKIAVQRMENNSILAFLALSFVFCFLFPMISNISGYNIAFRMPLSYSVFYFIAGFYCRRLFECGRVNNKICGVVVAVSAAVIVLLVYFGAYRCVSDDYACPLIAVMSVSLFLFFLNLNMTVNEKWGRRLWVVDRLCFTVYLIHPVFIQLAYRKLNCVPIGSCHWIGATIIAFVVFSVLSYFFAVVLTKIPLLKRVLA
ncbi:MAG: acyltransferase family protein [Fibrobacter sp.]|nr:acyltransferase family protein [Fibrobacter sp.]